MAFRQNGAHVWAVAMQFQLPVVRVESGVEPGTSSSQSFLPVGVRDIQESWKEQRGIFQTILGEFEVRYIPSKECMSAL